jgi:hypothetical protein
MSKQTARTELLRAAVDGGWQIEYQGSTQRRHGGVGNDGCYRTRTVHLVRVHGGERDAEIVLEFTDSDAYATGTYSARGSSVWKRMTKAEVLSQLDTHGPAHIARREAEREARHEAERQEREARNRAREQERSAERTRLQNEVYNLVINAASAREVQGGVNTGTVLVTPQPRDIATEIVCLLQQEDSPLVALVDAWRAHLAAEAGVRADALEREALAAKEARA